MGYRQRISSDTMGIGYCPQCQKIVSCTLCLEGYSECDECDSPSVRAFTYGDFNLFARAGRNIEATRCFFGTVKFDEVARICSEGKPVEARLDDTDGKHVATVTLPAFKKLPRIITWGERFFVLYSHTAKADGSFGDVLYREEYAWPITGEDWVSKLQADLPLKT